jgi:hypothetical protein
VRAIVSNGAERYFLAQVAGMSRFIHHNRKCVCNPIWEYDVTVVQFEPNGWHFIVQPVLIFEWRSIFGGELIKAY